MAYSPSSKPAGLSSRLFSRKALLGDKAILAYIAAVGFVGHVLVAGNYGYFRDELYYIVSGQHLSFGYVDFPPMIAFLAAALNFIAGDSLLSIHVVSSLVGAFLVFVSGMIARELGGARRSQVLTAVATLGTLVFLATSSIFSMDIIDALWWSLCAYLLIRIIKRDQPKLWLVLGLVAGLGLMTKLTIAFFLFAIIVGLALTPSRRYFRTKWFWLGGLISFGFLLPYIMWNALSGWPTVQFYFNYGGLTGGGPLGFFLLQLFAVNLANVPLVILGLLFYFRGSSAKQFRAIGLAYVVLYVVFTLINAKAYFLVPAYPMLFAGGALFIEKTTRNRRWITPAYAVTIAIVALLFVPLVMPVLPPATYVNSYYESLTGLANGGAGQQNAGPFPQFLGDRFGWNTMVSTVAQVYNSLPPPDRSQACIFTLNYGEASALTLLGKDYGLPPVISGHNNFWIWGPGTCSGSVIITVGLTQSQDLQTFSNVSQAGLVTCQYCMNEENNLPVYVCTQPKITTQSAWAAVKHFN